MATLTSRSTSLETQQLRATLGKMDVALGAIVEAIAWTDTSGIVEWCNASFESLVGVPHTAILRKRLTEVLPLSRNGEPIPRHAHPVERSMRDEAVETETYDFIRDDLRRILEVSIRAVCLMSREKSVVITLRDVTSRHDREHALEEQRAFLELLQAVTELSNDVESEEMAIRTVMNLVSDYGNWPVAHASFVDNSSGQLNIEPSQIWHLSSMNYLMCRRMLEDVQELVETMVRQAVKTSKPIASSLLSGIVEAAVVVPVLSGRDIVAVLEFYSDQPQLADERTLDGLGQIGIQLGRAFERKRSETDLRNAHSQLEFRVIERTVELAKANEALTKEVDVRRKAEALKDELVATVSHELRTPLTSLLGFTELMLEQDFSFDQRQEFLKIIHGESQRLTNLINDFLDLQKLESGRMVYHFEPSDLLSCLKDTAAVFGNRTTHRFILEVEPEMPLAHADDNRIRQVLANLCSNAVKFSPDGGDVTLRARVLEGEIELSVQDQGLGMAPEVVPCLFQKFFRADNADTRNIGGTGLGLALIREIITAHRGRVWVESELGKGSTFFFTLPVYRPEQ